MPDIVISALSTALFLVRFIKGPWMRHPQYVAAALVGALAAGLILAKLAPEAGGSFILGGLSGIGGAWIGIVAFDALIAG